NTEFGGERDHAKRVADVVLPGHAQGTVAEFLVAALHAEGRRKIMQFKTGRAIPRGVAEAIGNRRLMRFADSPGVRIVGAKENRAFSLGEQLPKDFLDRHEVLVEIEMLFFDVKYERVFRLEKLQRAIALVALRDEKFAAPIPVRVAAQNWNFRADIMRRMQATAAQNVRRHRCRGRFSMHARDDDSAFAEHDCGEGFSAANRGNLARTRVRQNRVVLLNRGGKNDQLDAAGVLCPMRGGEAQSKLRE